MESGSEDELDEKDIPKEALRPRKAVENIKCVEVFNDINFYNEMLRELSMYCVCAFTALF